MEFGEVMTTEQTINYNQGDWIVHCHHGVGQIEEVEHKSIGDQENVYYRIKTSDSVMWIPVDQINSDEIRPLTDTAHLEEAVSVLNNPPGEMPSNLNARKARIKKVIVNNMPVKTARLIRDLRAKRRSKKGLNQTERRALKDLTKRFVQEWAVCKGITIEQARNRLNRRINRKSKTSNNPSANGSTAQKKRPKYTMRDALLKESGKWAKWLAQQIKKQNL